MIIKNADVVMKNSVLLREVRVENGKITEIGTNISVKDGEDVYDANGAYLLPGFIDTHTHGAMMQTFGEADADFEKVTVFEAQNGITTIAVSIASRSHEDFVKAAQKAADVIEKGGKGAKIGGIHAEGPFLNINKKGGMHPEHILMPDVEEFEKLCEACRGHLKIITIAPELDGAAALIKFAKEKGVKVSAGHTEATYDEMMSAIDMGVTRATHTFNAMMPLNHREVGVLGAVLDDKRVNCEMICDFVHLNPVIVNMIYKLKGSGNITVISDSEKVAGIDAEGELLIDGRKVYVNGNKLTLEDGTICGSVCTLYSAFLNLHSLGIPIWEISEMMSGNPAKALCIYDSTGSIETGKCADLVVIDKKTLKIRNTFVNGISYEPRK